MQTEGYQGCGSSLAIPFFLSFQVIAGWLILNLTVAAVIDGLNEAQENHASLINSDDIDRFMEVWLTFDKKQKFKISAMEFLFFLAELG